jgi:hypothetical protein
MGTLEKCWSVFLDNPKHEAALGVFFILVAFACVLIGWKTNQEQVSGTADKKTAAEDREAVCRKRKPKKANRLLSP